MPVSLFARRPDPGMLLNLWKNERPAPTALPGEAKSTSRARLNIAGISDPI